MRKPTAMKRCMQEAGVTSHSCSSLLVLAEGKPLTPKLRLVLGTTAVQGWIVWARDQNALQPHPQSPAGAAQPGCQVMPTTHTSFNSPISGTGSSAPWIWQTITLRCQNEQNNSSPEKSSSGWNSLPLWAGYKHRRKTVCHGTRLFYAYRPSDITLF